MQIPAEANTYDGVYAIEATCHAPNKHGIYRCVASCRDMSLHCLTLKAKCFGS